MRKIIFSVFVVLLLAILVSGGRIKPSRKSNAPRRHPKTTEPPVNHQHYEEPSTTREPRSEAVQLAAVTGAFAIGQQGLDLISGTASTAKPDQIDQIDSSHEARKRKKRQAPHKSQHQTDVSLELCTELFGGPCDKRSSLRIINEAKAILEGRRSCGPDLRGLDCTKQAQNLLNFMMQQPQSQQPESAANQCYEEQQGNVVEPDEDSAMNDTVCYDQVDGNLLDESAQTETCSQSSSHDAETVSSGSLYEPEMDRENKRRRSLRISTVAKIVDMKRRRCSDRAIKAKYQWYNSKYDARFLKYVEDRGSRLNRLDLINDHVRDQVEANQGRYLRGYHLLDWAMEKAIDIGYEDFKASQHWLKNFKAKHNIGARKVTKYVTGGQVDQTEVIRQRVVGFRNEYKRLSPKYSDDMIINFDQTGFKYEPTSQRTLAFRGARDIVIRIGSEHRTRHSYTSLPMITRRGEAVGKLLICLQERNGTMPKSIKPKVEELERKFGNIRVVWTKSGVMTGKLMQVWAKEVLKPAVDEMRKKNRRKRVLLIADTWSGQRGGPIIDFMREEQWDRLAIPEKTTGDIQPLDVVLMRQYKIFLNRLTELARQLNMTDKITDRLAVLNVQSLVWNQFMSPAYKDLLLYAWHDTDPDFSRNELRRFPPLNVDAIQFKRDLRTRCEVPGCTRKSHIRCSHCGKNICLAHFLERICFHTPAKEFPRFLQAGESQDIIEDEYERFEA